MNDCSSVAFKKIIIMIFKRKKKICSSIELAFVDSVFEPRMSQNRGLAAITVVIQQLLVCSDVSGRHQDQMRASVDGVKLRLAVSSFTVVDESPKTLRFLCSIHTGDGNE